MTDSMLGVRKKVKDDFIVTGQLFNRTFWGR